MNYETHITRITVAPEKEPIFSEMATTVSIEDEAAGEFVVVEQLARYAPGKIAIDPDGWPALRKAIDRMIKECRSETETNCSREDLCEQGQRDNKTHCAGHR